MRHPSFTNRLVNVAIQKVRIINSFQSDERYLIVKIIKKVWIQIRADLQIFRFSESTSENTHDPQHRCKQVKQETWTIGSYWFGALNGNDNQERNVGMKESPLPSILATIVNHVIICEAREHILKTAPIKPRTPTKRILNMHQVCQKPFSVRSTGKDRQTVMDKNEEEDAHLLFRSCIGRLANRVITSSMLLAQPPTHHEATSRCANS